MVNSGSLMEVKESVRDKIQESVLVTQKMAEQQSGTIAAIASRLGEALRSRGTVYICGNGGSAADAQHIAAEFVGRFLRERHPMPAVALTTNTSIITAIGNDYSYEEIFARQIRACVTPLDVVVGISTSGKSENVLEGLRAARKMEADTIGFTGSPGEPLSSHSDLCLCVPSSSTPHIQEAHIVAWHIICGLIEDSVIYPT